MVLWVPTATREHLVLFEGFDVLCRKEAFRKLGDGSTRTSLDCHVTSYEIVLIETPKSTVKVSPVDSVTELP